jgi:hypothetical protein
LIGEAVVDAVEMIAPLFDAIVDMVEDLSGEMTDLGPIIEMVFDAIIEGMRLWYPVIKDVFAFLAEHLANATKGFIFLATVMKNLAQGNVTGALSAGFAAVDDFDRRRAERQKDREKRRAELQAPGAAGTGRHAPTVVQQKPELFGIVDAWKKVQTAVQGPEESAEKEQLKLAREAAKQRERQTKALESMAGESPNPDWTA